MSIKLSEQFPDRTKREKLQTLELIKRELELRKGLVFDLKKFCHPKQYDFVSDPAPYATAVTSRRAGKTVGCAADLIDTCLKYPNTTSLYLTLSRVNAKILLWPTLKRINHEYRLGGTVNESELSMKFRGDSFLYLSGVKDISEIEKFRGMALKKVYLDEAQAMRSYIEQLVDDVLDPACIDHNGKIRVTGTPGPVPVGYFHDIATDPKLTAWKRHSFSIWDNPFITNAAERLQMALERRGITIEDPSIQREFFGKWALDLNALVIRYDAARNDYETLPPHVPWEYVVVADFGFEDADAIATIAFSHNHPDAYLVEEQITTKQGITPLAAQLTDHIQRYKPMKVLGDFGALGTKIAYELQTRFGIPIEAAEKSRKLEYIELLNDSLRTGRLKAKKGSRFAQDAQLLEWDRENPEKPKISDRFHSDICLARGTLVSTKRGPLEIELVNETDYVLTRKGWRKVLARAMTARNAETVVVSFSGGYVVTCTPGHKVFTNERGFIPAKDLRHSDSVCMDTSCQAGTSQKTTQWAESGLFRKEKRHGLMGVNFIGIRNLTRRINETTFGAIGEIARSAFIRHAGSFITQSLQKVFMFITGTGTFSTMPLRTWSVCQDLHTSAVTRGINQLRSMQSDARILSVSAPWLLSGTEAKKAAHGTGSTPKATFIKMEDGPRLDVYNLTVDDAHEYFANGILVKNCDAVIYGHRELLHWLWKEPVISPKPGTLERMKEEESEIWDQVRSGLTHQKDEETFWTDPWESDS